MSHLPEPSAQPSQPAQPATTDTPIAPAGAEVLASAGLVAAATPASAAAPNAADASADVQAETVAAPAVDVAAIAVDGVAAGTASAERTAEATATDTATTTQADRTDARPRVPDLSPAACADLLKKHFPALFTGQPKPLKLRIQQDIQQRAPGVFSKGSLGAFFRRYTGSTGYLIALGKSQQRFDLDGAPAGELSEEHRALAREELARRRQLGRDRDQAAQALQQAAQAEVLQARQARLSLLRDFERTTLTLANFCALKGLTPETLNPQLELARREAAEAPPPRPFDDRRGPPGPRRDGHDGPRRDGRHDGRRDGHQDGRPPRAAGPDNRGEGRGEPRRDARGDGRGAGRGEGHPGQRPPSARPPGRPGGR